jgi:hypothetical protein
MSPEDAYIKIENDDGAGPIEHVILEGARLVMKDANEHDLWDQPPTLWAVTQGPVLVDADHLPDHLPEDVVEAIREHGALGQQLGFAPLDINPQAWTTGPPAQVLTRLSRFAAKHPPRLEEGLEQGQRIIGLLFMSEAWMVAAEDSPELREAGIRREIHKHPGRVEIRLVYGVDLAGYHYSMRHTRGGEDSAETIQGPGIDPTGRERMSGDIPDALERLLAALTPETV